MNEDPDPYVGQVVLYNDEAGTLQKPHVAIITRVWSETCVNLVYFLDGSEDWEALRDGKSAAQVATSAVKIEPGSGQVGWYFSPG